MLLLCRIIYDDSHYSLRNLKGIENQSSMNLIT